MGGGARGTPIHVRDPIGESKTFISCLKLNQQLKESNLNTKQTVHLEGEITIHTEYKTLCISHHGGDLQIVDKDTGEIVYQYEAPFS